MDALTFLQSVGGYVASERQSSADKSIRTGKIDPAWSALDGLLPKVTFEGESVLSGKRYAYAGGYFPVGGDRVWLVPVGTTYLIVGSVNNPGKQGFESDAAGNFYATHFGGASARVEVDSGHSTLYVDEATVGGKVLVQNEGGLGNLTLGGGSTNVATYGDIPGSTSFSFQKLYSSTQTKLRVWLSVTARVDVTFTNSGWGVRVNGTDYDVAHNEFGTTSAHQCISGGIFITGVPAGTYTVQGRYKRDGGTGSIFVDNNDRLTVLMAEVPV